MKPADMIVQDRDYIDVAAQGSGREIQVVGADVQTKIREIRKRSNRGQDIMYMNIKHRR
jgi:hypothetical protein